VADSIDSAKNREIINFSL